MVLSSCQGGELDERRFRWDGGADGTTETPDATVSTETCDDGLDNDRDGLVDEGCRCAHSNTQACFSGPYASRQVGVCADGVQRCPDGGEFLTWGMCEGEVTPSSEQCGNGLDDDCDGLTDCADSDCDSKACGSAGQCVARACCEASDEVCDNVDNDCDGTVDEGFGQTCCTPGMEVCDNVDNDCDGTVDEALVQACGDAVGECSQGQQTCIAGSWGACMGQGSGSNELCDNKDNDCDGKVDESLVQACGSKVGACMPGVRTCSAGAWGTCNDQGPGNESCNNVDDDCDNFVDEYPCTECGQIERIAGPDRFGTAIAASKKFFPGGASYAIVFGIKPPCASDPCAENHGNPDGVLAGTLAGRRAGPILLTFHASQSSNIHSGTLSEIQRVNPSRVYIIGGTGAVSATAENQIKSAGFAVSRFAGANRADTARLVAQHAGAPSKTAFVVNQGTGTSPLVDGSIVAGLSKRLRYPILYVTQSSVPSETSAAISNLGITKTYVIGGTGAVSNTVKASLPNATRISGSTRYETALNVANWALGKGAPSSPVVVVRAFRPVDAMTAAAGGYIHILADKSSLHTSTRTYLNAQKPQKGYLMGGTVVFDAGMTGPYCAAVARGQ